MSQKTAVVTGASSGIGFSVAEGFLRQGDNVLLNGRTEEKLDRAAERLGVCDVGSESLNPIIQARAFLEPAMSAPRFVVGARAQGLRTCAKHFPGHGATQQDSHSDLPRVDAPLSVWCERDLPPFAAAIAAGVDAVMTAHLAAPALTGDESLTAAYPGVNILEKVNLICEFFCRLPLEAGRGEPLLNSAILARL